METPPAFEAPINVVPLDREPIARTSEASEPKMAKQAGLLLKLATVVLFFAAVASGALVGVSKFKVAGLTEAIGLSDTSGFALQGIGIKSIPTNAGKMTLAFNGVLKNNLAVTKTSPVLKVIIYDRSNREVRALDYQFPVAQVEAGKTLPFDPKIKNIPDSISRVVLDLGNPVEQLLR